MFEQIADRILNFVETERRSIYEASFEFQAEQMPQFPEWLEIIREIPRRDDITIILTSESEESVTIKRDSEEEKYFLFIQEIPEDSMISVKVDIQKKVEDSRFSVYHFDKFSEDLINLDMPNAMKAFSSMLEKTEKYIIFEIFHGQIYFHTKTLYFFPAGETSIPENDFERKQRLRKCREIAYFYNQESFELLPDDFKIEVNDSRNPLRELFAKLEAFFSICYLSTNSAIREETLKAQIIGQRSVEFEYNLADISENPILYKIYDWIYASGNSIDKAIIARNIICLHCKYESLLNMDERALGSIQSSYNLYLKDNVIQYLELKNKIAEFISSISSKTGEYAMELLDKFKTNLIAIMVFLFTVIITNIVSEQPINNIFTNDICSILEMVIAGSAVYLYICYKQSEYQMKKVYDSYDCLKKSYEGILTQEDINECFQNDNIKSQIKQSVEKVRSIFAFVWIVFLIFLLAFIEYMGDEPIIWPFIKMIISSISIST